MKYIIFLVSAQPQRLITTYITWPFRKCLHEKALTTTNNFQNPSLLSRSNHSDTIKTCSKALRILLFPFPSSFISISPKKIILIKEMELVANLIIKFILLNRCFVTMHTFLMIPYLLAYFSYFFGDRSRGFENYANFF